MTGDVLGIDYAVTLATAAWVGPLVIAILLAVWRWSGWFAATVGLMAMLVELAFIGHALWGYDGGQTSVQRHEWIPGLGIGYHVAFDGLSLVLVALCAFCFPVALIYGLWARRDPTRGYVALLLVLQAALVLLFVARDLVLFYVGFEAMLLPLVFMLGIWGGANRARATLRFVIYTLVGSLLMLLAIITIGLQAGTFDVGRIGTSDSTWLFLAFMAAFAIKSPFYPLHGWVPDAYREAPPEVAGLLSGVVSKAGAYGILRFALPIFPGVAADWQTFFIAITLIGLLWCSLVAFRQPDSRGVIAYSSIAQMSLIGLGIFAFEEAGSTGAAFQMVNHGLLSMLLFLCAGYVEVRYGTGLFARLGGLARGRTALATVVLTTGVCALAVPGSNLFASEFLVLLGAFRESYWVGALASLAIVLAAMYMLRWISALLHEPATEPEPEPEPRVRRTRTDIRWEAVYIVPLLVAVLALSAYPFFVTDRVEESVIALTAPAAVADGK